MARSASSKRSSPKKASGKPKLKKSPAASRKAAKGKGPAKLEKRSTVKGKPRTASTRSAKGAANAPKRSPKTSAKRAGKPAAAQPTQPTSESGGSGASAASKPRIEVLNVNVPGYRNTVDADKFTSMRDTMFSFLPRAPPGMTQTEMMEAARAKADRAVFPGGDKSEWWLKAVQLDQEARGAMKRSNTKPLRWWRS